LRDFGQIATGVQSTILTINMINNSANELTSGTYTKSGDVNEFIVVKSPPFGLDSGTTGTMEIQFYSISPGTFTATIELSYFDGTSTILFRINVTGEAVALVPVIQVDLATSGGLNIPHQDPATLANTRDFDTVNGGSSSVPIDIVITNAGTAPLDVIVDMGSVDWFHFTINGIPTNPTPSAITQTIPPQTNWSFSIAFEPDGTYPGQKDAYVRITHNDQGHASYSSPGWYEIPVKGFCVTSAPLIDVLDGSILAHNDTAAGNRDFGDIVRNTTSAPLTITISNSGGSAMSVGVPALGGTGMSEYSLDLTNFGAPAAAVSLAANSSITFDIIFAPTSVGQKDATVSFTHNDTTVTSPFIINITGTGVLAAPVIEVSDGSTLLANPDTLDFGQQDVTAGPTAAVVITVENIGTAPLTLGLPTFNPVTSNFVLNTTGFPTSLVIGASATFSIEFDPAQEGPLTAIIEFAHNDGTTGTPYILNLTGVGIAPVVEVREGSTTGVVVNSGDVAILGGGRDLGSIDVSAGATGPITISLKNTGSLNLDIYTIALAGTNVTDFILNAPAGTTLATGADASFTITFDPTLGGIKDAQIVLTHNDPTNPSPFIIRIIGTAVDPNGVRIATTSLPAGNSDVVYMPTALTAIQGTAPYVWTVYSGNLPAGLTLSSEGSITGTPNSLVTNTYEFTVRVTDTTGATHEKQLSIIVVGSVIVPVGSPGASGCVATGGALALPLLLSLLLLAAYRRRRREEV
ncbi:MAG: choice-of-anchor D domain-containing protein, partial [Planctomycetes bacterium]|nr:choice-of-anchor D domain-containing protein [Planctomycetota bacterium]